MLKNLISLRKTERGASLIEVLVVVAIMGIVALGTATIFDNQLKQIKALSQKQEMIDLKGLMLLLLSNPDICTWQLKNKTINVSSATDETKYSPTNLAFDKLYQGTGTSSAVLVETDKPLPSSLTGLVVSSIAFKNIYATGAPNEYRGVFEIVFDEKSLPFVVKPLQVSQLLRTNESDPVSAKRIESCVGGATVTPQSNCQTLSAAHPWIKKELICNTASGGKSILTLSNFSPTGLATYSASHGHEPLTVTYKSDTGVFVRSYDGPTDDARSCIGPNLKDIIKDANNGCL